MKNAALCFTIPLGVAVVSTGALVAVGWNGWPGETTSTSVLLDGFGESLRPGPIRQPANTWSNLGFYLVGLLIGRRAWRDERRVTTRDWRNPMVTTLFYPASYATLSVLIGAASAALHASTTRWAAELDYLAMQLWGAWCIAYAASRLLRGSHALFGVLFATQVAALAARLWLEEHPRTILGNQLFGLMVAVAIAIELIGRRRNQAIRRAEVAYLLWSIATFGAGYGIWQLSRRGGYWFVPDTLWQGHAIWHLLCAGSIALVYLYARSERLVEEASNGTKQPTATSSTGRRPPATDQESIP